jgi:hypothetical protein
VTHPESLELLPWYATLSREQQKELDAHVATCAECASELAEIRSLHQDMAAIDDTPEPSPFLLQRTLARIESHEAEKAAGGWRRLFAWWRLNPVTTRMLVVSQAVLVIGLAVGLVYYRQQAQFVTQSGAGGATGIRFLVRFKPEISEQMLRDSVRQVGGSIVDGPSALGLYTVQIPKDGTAQRVLEQLQQNSNVGFVQQVPE